MEHISEHISEHTTEHPMEHISEFKAPPKVTSLTELIEELHRVFACDRVNVDYVQRLMTGYASNAADWKQFAKRDKFK